MIVITLPIYWQQSSKKTVLTSMNSYRNWHYHVASKFKRDFAELVKSQVSTTDTLSKYRLEIQLYYKNKNCDGSNIIPLIEKVLLDALIDINVLTNDTVQQHIGTTWSAVAQDVTNPRCEIQVIPLTEIKITNDTGDST